MPDTRPDRLPAVFAGEAATALRTWARTRTAPGSAEMGRLAPGERVGTLRVPFPDVPHAEYVASVRGRGIVRRVEEAQVRRVPVAGLTAIQRTINAERLEQHLEDPGLVPEGSRKHGSGMLKDRPVVVRLGGRSYIHDGHHRITAALLRGEREVKARVVDLDAEA